jgi:uncharacterized protein (UPF0332 family)
VTPHASQPLVGTDRAIAAARRELEADDIETAAERACVAMLRSAKACLEVDGLSPGSTQAVCVAYGRRFGRSARLNSAYHRWLLDAADLRKASVGELAGPIDRDAAATAVERAEIFRDVVAGFMERNG